MEQLKLDSVLAYGFIENKIREVLHDRVDHFYYMDDNHIVKCIVSPYTFPVSVKRLHIRHTPDDVINAVMKELKSVIVKKKDEFINFISSLQDDIKNNECIKL